MNINGKDLKALLDIGGTIALLKDKDNKFITSEQIKRDHSLRRSLEEKYKVEYYGSNKDEGFFYEIIPDNYSLLKLLG